MTDIQSDFRTQIIFENVSSELEPYELNKFDKDGNPQPFVLGSLQPGEIQIIDAFEELGSDSTSHFIIGSERYPSENIRIKLSYGLKSGQGSPAYVQETSAMGKRWRVFSGNWSEVFDAVAVINFGNENADIKIVQIGVDGSILKEVLIGEKVFPMSKTLYVIGALDSSFDRSLSPVFEVASDQDIGVIALQGDLENSKYMWVNPVEIR